MPEIRYSIPNVGAVEIPLYPPADEVYSLLENVGEIERLARLKHIGALEFAYPGVSHSRWDYTVSMLYVITRLRRLVTNSNFSLGDANFTSMPAALQCLALLSNIGHLPGTYCVEKGVARFLLGANRGTPINCLFESTFEDNLAQICQTVNAANKMLRERDYLVLNRLCAIIKLITNFGGRAVVPQWIAQDLFAPFMIPDLRSPDSRWLEIDEYFDTSRRLAYLNRDTALVDSPITVGLSPLLSNLIDPDGLTRDALLQSQEIIAAFEHTVYERFYHSPQAQRATATVASSVFARLQSEPNPASMITNWMYENGMGVVFDEAAMRERIRHANLVGSASLRSFFLDFSGTESEVEDVLENLLGSAEEPQIQAAVVASKYITPDSQHALEPDHVHLDAFISGTVRAYHVGRLIKWLADDLDKERVGSEDNFAWLVRPEVARIYEVLLSRAVEVAWPDMRLVVKPWPLSRLGKFKERDGERDDTSIWLTSSDLGDKFTAHIVRDNSTVPAAYASLRDEMRGLSQLRNQLRKSWETNRNRPRKRHFLITGSIRLLKNTVVGQIQREFDGGILQISSRTGSPKLYLLETKGAQSPTAAENRLIEKLSALGINGKVFRLRRHSAYAVLTM